MSNLKIPLTKRIIILAALLLIIIIFYVLYSKNIQRIETSVNIDLSTLFFISLTFFISYATLIYLQSANKDTLQKKQNSLSFIEIEKRMILMQKELHKKETIQELSNDNKNQIIEEAINRVSKESIEEIFTIQTEKLKKNIKKEFGLEAIKDSFINITGRLVGEIQDLRLRSNVNLILGMAITSGGLIMLWDTVDSINSVNYLTHLINGETTKKETKDIIISILPRFLLVIFIETFAYFFLRLYKLGLEEIKYFQNELTNVESKFIAIEVAYISKDNKAMRTALELLAETERNFILKKGETTVALEKAKSESENMQNIIKAVPNLFKNKGK